jgi:membrane protease YdiL (CAAX protease family)
MADPRRATEDNSTRLPAAIYALAVIPFFANDVGFILAENAGSWLTVDYGSKLAALAVVALAPTLQRAVREGSGRPRAPWRDVTATAVVSVLAIALFMAIDALGLDADTTLQAFFPLDETWLIAVDLTAGLALTAVAEELIFRRLFLDVFQKRLAVPALYGVSAALFAAIHWSNGLGTIGGAFLTGLMLLWLTRRTGTVLPAIAAHYIINLVLFWP